MVRAYLFPFKLSQLRMSGALFTLSKSSECSVLAYLNSIKLADVCNYVISLNLSLIFWMLSYPFAL